MKPAWAALGIILLLSSMFTALGAYFGTGESTSVDWQNDPSPAHVDNSWNVSRVLNQSDFFKVEISPAQDWSKYLDTSAIYSKPFKTAFVNITDSSGNETEFSCDFLRLSDDPTKALVFYNLTGTGVNDTIEAHGIDQVMFELPYGNSKPGIVAQALSSGNYTATVTWLFGGGSAPFSMKLSKGIPVTTRTDYTNLYPVGLGLFAVSAVLLVYGFRNPKKTVPRRKVNVH